MKGWPGWAVAASSSVVAHVAFLALIALAVRPEPVPDQRPVEARLDLAAYEVPEFEAQAQPATGESVAEGTAQGAGVSGIVVPASRAQAAPLSPDRATPSSTDAAAQSLAALTARAEAPLASAASAAVRVTADLAPGERVRESAASVQAISSASPSVEQAVDARLAPGLPAERVAPPVASASLKTPNADEITGVRPDATASPILFAAAPPLLSLAAAPEEVREAALFAPAASPALASVSRLDTARPPAERSRPVETAGLRPAALAVPAAPTSSATELPGAPSAQIALSSTPAAGLVPPQSAAALNAPIADDVSSDVPVGQAAPILIAAAAPLPSIGASPEAASDLPAVAASATLKQPGATKAAPSVPERYSAPSSPAGEVAEVPAVTTPQGDRATAALAWSGAGGAAVDPVSLAAIQAFMRPGDLSQADSAADNVRDGIAALLAAVPCSRLQTEFRPGTGALELRGHIPEESLRAPVLAALGAQIGASIPIADNLLILPRPQCGALSALAAAGLPQSTEQLSDPRIVGQDTHARIYDFAEGQLLEFDLTGPEYQAVFYVDYYDADGMVLHLQPNEYLGLEPVAPDEDLSVGGLREDGGGFEIFVSPPFGQEIMVGMAASHPLYEGLRPIQEPADEYLVDLEDLVARARAEHPDFKGEWVYFFVRTRAR